MYSGLQECHWSSHVFFVCRCINSLGWQHRVSCSLNELALSGGVQLHEALQLVLGLKSTVWLCVLLGQIWDVLLVGPL